jgi:alpha-L-rhamnosidase
MNWLMEEIDRHKGHLSTGIFSTEMMFNVLREWGKNDLAYRIANQRDYPGWGYMLQRGATTLWETWKYPDNAPSQNHPMFGSVSEWFYKSLLGMNSIGPGFSKIRIQPMPAGDLKWAKGSYQSVRGKIVSEWEIINGQFKLHVVIPANTRAEVWMPAKEGGEIRESGKEVIEENGVKLLGNKMGYKGVEVGSGEYFFSVRGKE